MYIYTCCFFCPCLVIWHIVKIVCCVGIGKYNGFHSESSSSSQSRIRSLACSRARNCVAAVLWISTEGLNMSSCEEPFRGTALSSWQIMRLGIVSSCCWHSGHRTFGNIPSKSFLIPLIVLVLNAKRKLMSSEFILGSLM